MRAFLRFVQVLSKNLQSVWLQDKEKQHLYKYAQVHDTKRYTIYFLVYIKKNTK